MLLPIALSTLFGRFRLSLGLASLFAAGPVIAQEAADPLTKACPAYDAAEYAAALELPEQDYSPSPAMWKIADGDTVIHLFGTVHLLPEGFKWRTPALDAVIERADKVVFETRDSDDGDEAMKGLEMMRLRALVQIYGPTTPLTEQLTAENRAKFLQLLDIYEIKQMTADRLPPFLTMLLIAQKSSERSGSMRELGVETVIEREFKAAGKPIIAIEDQLDVLEKLFKIGEERTIEIVNASIAEWDVCEEMDPQAVDWTAEQQWARGELTPDVLDELRDDPFGRAVYDILLTQRNEAWAQWIESRLETPGSLLIAVGAGHMVGETSLLRLLADKGIVATRVQ